MKQITLYVYQSIDGCPARADKQVENAILNADSLLIDGEVYLELFMNHLGWPLTDKDTLVVTQAECNLTEKGRVRFITGDAAAELRRMKADGDGVIVAYGQGIAAILLDNGLADEVVVVTVPEIAGSGEKALPGAVKDGAAWVVRSCKMLDGEKVKTVFGRV